MQLIVPPDDYMYITNATVMNQICEHRSSCAELGCTLPNTMLLLRPVHAISYVANLRSANGPT